MQASWGRSDKQQQEQTSQNHVQRNFLSSVNDGRSRERALPPTAHSLPYVFVALREHFPRVQGPGSNTFDGKTIVERLGYSATKLHISMNDTVKKQISLLLLSCLEMNKNFLMSRYAKKLQLQSYLAKNL